MGGGRGRLFVPAKGGAASEEQDTASSLKDGHLSRCLPSGPRCFCLAESLH